jgi:hypothetical protein
MKLVLESISDFHSNQIVYYILAQLFALQWVRNYCSLLVCIHVWPSCAFVTDMYLLFSIIIDFHTQTETICLLLLTRTCEFAREIWRDYERACWWNPIQGLTMISTVANLLALKREELFVRVCNEVFTNCKKMFQARNVDPSVYCVWCSFYFGGLFRLFN